MPAAGGGAASVPDRVVLLRHAMPQVLEHIAARDWQLGPDGRAAARTLRTRLPPGALPVASDEPKAAQTVWEATGGVAPLRDAGFAEVHRPHEWSARHRERARAYVEGCVHPGWETHTAVIARFDAAITRHATDGRTLLIGTHGMAATVWLTAHTTIAPGPFWTALRFPDLIDVDLRAGTATTLH